MSNSDTQNTGRNYGVDSQDVKRDRQLLAERRSGIDWKDVTGSISKFLDLLFSAFAPLFSKKDYDFEGKYQEMTGKPWETRSSISIPGTQKLPGLKEAWEKPGVKTYRIHPDETAQLPGRTFGAETATAAHREEFNQIAAGDSKTPETDPHATPQPVNTGPK